jgi:hypothetical protein
MKKELIIANCRIKLAARLSTLRDIASNHTAYGIKLKVDLKRLLM